MSVFTRNLTFHSNNLGHNATLLLTFNDESMDGIYKDFFPTAWRVSTFGGNGPYSMTISYHSQLAFIKLQAENNIIVSASTWRNIDFGQSTTLTESGSTFSFLDPTPGAPGAVQACNKTTSRQGLGLGLNNNTDVQPTTVLYFPNIDVNNNVTAKFRPKLKAYIITSIQQNQILLEPVETPAIWEADLATLGPNSSFTLTYDICSTTYAITQDFAAFDLGGQLGAIAARGSSDLDQVIDLLGEFAGKM